MGWEPGRRNRPSRGLLDSPDLGTVLMLLFVIAVVIGFGAVSRLTPAAPTPATPLVGGSSAPGASSAASPGASAAAPASPGTSAGSSALPGPSVGPTIAPASPAPSTPSPTPRATPSPRRSASPRPTASPTPVVTLAPTPLPTPTASPSHAPAATQATAVAGDRAERPADPGPDHKPGPLISPVSTESSRPRAPIYPAAANCRLATRISRSGSSMPASSHSPNAWASRRWPRSTSAISERCGRLTSRRSSSAPDGARPVRRRGRASATRCRGLRTPSGPGRRSCPRGRRSAGRRRPPRACA